ncbi:phosphoenolpyruvate--protein phosphotransferase [Acidothermaceae bacterium B102]|nr:phosphoenolpyruvate--protein phosphotransferase [Acidothermaceae bacterium B102]
MPDATVGLVVVSHSRVLARAAVALAMEMVHDGSVRVAVAAGLDESTFGTDAVAIKDAIEEVDGPAGVVVLMDLGSAVLSAELALDLLSDPAARDRVLLSAAPLVEGLVVAAVTAAGGASRDQVAAEARSALLGKASGLGESPEDAAPSSQVAAAEARGTFVVSNVHGLHARPAARLVVELRSVDADVWLRNLDTGAAPVPGSSLSRVATLGALAGHTVEVTASGPQASEAVRRVLALAERQFDEVAEPPVTAVVTTAGPLPASPGVAIGPARRLTRPPLADDIDHVVLSPDDERRRLLEGVEIVRRDTEAVRTSAARQLGSAEAAIFDAHLLLLSDPDLLGEVHRGVDSGLSAVSAWRSAVSGVEAEWAALPDDYLRARAADVRAVGDDVLRALLGAASATLSGVGVLVAVDLTPAETASLDPALVAGIVLAEGSPSSHAAILARAGGVPAVVNAGRTILDVAEGTILALNGTTGEVVVDPSPEVLDAFRALAGRQAATRTRDLAEADRPAVTLDGTRIEVGANIGSPADAAAAFAAGADSSGLVRTEFLFLNRDKAPTLDEQHAIYNAIAAAMGGRRIALRTLDVGGDKPLPYLPTPKEDNPFLGLRGLRLSLQDPSLFVEQLTAICLTARTSPVSVMFPMVSRVDELTQAVALLREAAGQRGLPVDLRVGIMVEVPAAALKVSTFLPHVDFFSIGTNDLTQYALAAERGNAGVAGLYDALDPGVLSLIAQTCVAAEGRALVSVCGESGSDPLAVPLLVGLGVRELSVAPAAVPQVKAQVRTLDVDLCRSLAAKALVAKDSAAVRALVAESLPTSRA